MTPEVFHTRTSFGESMPPWPCEGTEGGLGGRAVASPVTKPSTALSGRPGSLARLLVDGSMKEV